MPLAGPSARVRYCANRQHGACNWLVDAGAEPLCRACELNRTIPDLALPENLRRWRRVEIAKHRLVYSLLRLGLPIQSKAEAPETGLAFDFLAPPPGEDGQGKILTGHDNGEITLNVAEADDAIRAEVRQIARAVPDAAWAFPPRNRTLLFTDTRARGEHCDRFRKIFGDETSDYNQALQEYYFSGAPVNWQSRHISAYASSHPHEDWAETFAHYLHMIDTLETAYAFSLRISPRAGQDSNLSASISFDPYNQSSFGAILEAWLPTTFAVNSINRSMGLDDLYPFVISPEVAAKLTAVHDIVRNCREAGEPVRKRLLHAFFPSISWA